MALSIKNPEVERLARELAAKTGESMTDAVMVALRERLARQEHDRRAFNTRRLREIVADARKLPHLDTRSDEIMGYDEIGLPT